MSIFVTRDRILLGSEGPRKIKHVRSIDRAVTGEVIDTFVGEVENKAEAHFGANQEEVGFYGLKGTYAERRSVDLIGADELSRRPFTIDMYGSKSDLERSLANRIRSLTQHKTFTVGSIAMQQADSLVVFLASPDTETKERLIDERERIVSALGEIAWHDFSKLLHNNYDPLVPVVNVPNMRSPFLSTCQKETESLIGRDLQLAPIIDPNKIKL